MNFQPLSSTFLAAMLVRQATTEDIPALMALANHSPTAAHWTEQQYRTTLISSDPRRLLLVLDAGAAGICGLVVGCEIAGEWELENVVVARNFQGRGLGSKLMQALLDHVVESHAAGVFLEVRASNTAARALYESFGFQVVGKRPGYYHNPPEDAILYKKIL